MDPPILGDIPSHLIPQHPNPSYPKCEYHFYEFDCEVLEKSWPESNKRNRIWVDPQEAIVKLAEAKRPELIEAVKRCSVYKATL